MNVERKKGEGRFSLPVVLMQQMHPRIRCLTKDAVEGRRRSNPPLPLGSLIREPTFLRERALMRNAAGYMRNGAPKALSTTYTGSVSSSENEMSTSRLMPPYKKPRSTTDRQVVAHLRRKLNRRQELRLSQPMTDGDSSCGENLQDENSPAENRKVKKTAKPEDIFDMYTETGERKRYENSDPDDRINTANGSTDSNIASSDNQRTLHDEKMDPQIKSKLVSQDKDRLPNSQGYSTYDADSIVKPVISVSGTTPNGMKSPPSPHANEEKADGLVPPREVSPVPTPSLLRPSSGVLNDLSREERVRAIMAGLIHVECPTDSRAVKVFIHSAFTDTEAERTALIQHSIPELQRRCRITGHDLYLQDFHWASRDLMADDHSGNEFVRRELKGCLGQTSQVNCVTFLSHKYGEPQLLTTVAKSEFEEILNAANRDLAEEEAAAKARAAVARKQISTESDSETEDKIDEVKAKGNVNTKSRAVRLENTDSENNEGEEKKRDWRSALRTHIKSVSKEAAFITAIKEQRDRPEPELLEAWYKLDQNSLPPVYRLQKISAHYPEILRSDASKRQQARTAWQNVSRKLRHMFVKYSTKLFSPEVARKYSQTVADTELQQIIQSSSVPATNILWYQREIEDISYHLEADRARDFIDIVPMTTQKDELKQASLEEIKIGKLAHLVPHKNKTKYTVSWGQNGIDPEANRAHSSYVQRLARDFTDTITQTLIHQLPFKTDLSEGHWLEQEVLLHAAFCTKRGETLYGRKEVLNAIKQYMRSPGGAPLVLHGKAGSGLSTTVSKATLMIHKWMKKSGAAVIFRSIGASPGSTKTRTLIKGICLQLCRVFHKEPTGLPEDIRGLQNYFDFQLTEASVTSPVILVLDSLHMMADEEARKLSWLPKTLPKHVYLVITTCRDEKYETYGCLKNILSNQPERLIEHPDLLGGEIQTLLHHWLDNDSRTLTSGQWELLLKNCLACPLPLYLKLAYEESRRWPSYLPAENIKIPNSLKRMVGYVIGRLERDHAEPLVRRALGYLAASRNGVSETEMLDLLSLDDAVMDDMTTHVKPPIRRCPAFYWSRLRDDLGDLLFETECDQTSVLKWAHPVILEAVTERYLLQRDKAPSYHKHLAEYFSNMWYDNPKPFSGNEDGVIRHVQPQPLVEEISDDISEQTSTVFNQRRLSEMPHHLLWSQQFEQLKSQCLCNFEWVSAKLFANGLHSIFEEIQTALSVEPGDKDLLLLSETLHLSTAALTNEPRQLASQIVGRLQKIITLDVPTAPADPLRYPYMHPFYNQAKKTSTAAFIPSVTCLTPPGGVLFDLLSGHTDAITAVATSADGQRALTVSKDSSMKVWTLQNGRVSKTITCVGHDVLSVKFALNNSVAVTSALDSIKVWKLDSGQCVHVIEQCDDPAIMVPTEEGRLLVAFFDGSGNMKTWDLMQDCKLILQECISDDSEIHQDRSIVVSPTAIGQRVLHAFRSSNCATVRNCKSGNVVQTLKCHEKSASVSALNATKEYWVVAARCQHMKLHEIYVLNLFDVKNGQFLRSVRGCIHDVIDELYINTIGSHALSICRSEAKNCSDIAVWNIETEDHKHLAKHPNISKLAACSDLRFILTATGKDNIMRIWNLSGKVNQPVQREKARKGVAEIIPVQDNPRYVIARSMDNGPLTVWNVFKGKCAGTAVRIEHGLVDPSDVLLVQNTNVIILADKGFSSVNQDSRPLFQTVLIYDLKSKKYVRKLTGCYIVPSPPHEYLLTDNDHLIGPSESRTHFVVWSLKTGHAVHRIKTNFREMDERRAELGIIEEKQVVKKRNTTAYMTPWDRRAETKAARERRHAEEFAEEKSKLDNRRKERENAIEIFMVSGDRKVIVASFYAHFLCVFDLVEKKHVQVLENPTSMMFLHTAALSYTGSHLVHANYDDESKTSYVTLWDCRSGHVKRRLKNERNVCALAITDDADKVVIGKTPNDLHIWQPRWRGSNSVMRVKGYQGLRFGVGSEIRILKGGVRAVVFAGDISLWDLNRGSVLSVFTPDTTIQCLNMAMEERLIVLGMRDSSEVVTLRLVSKEEQGIGLGGENVFGEGSDSSSDEDEDEEDDDSLNGR